ncbi:MAG: adenylate/guanylate cyclase domain-containing protein [Ketobacteraceae bacterium]|nr:adenylate/guanylate cyclase domain-containing protein [Ketobacteraceae bacterium]
MTNQVDLDLAPLEAYNKDLPPQMVRFLAYLVGATTFGIGLYTQFFDPELWWLIPVALLYPVLSHYFTRPLRDRYPVATDASLLLLDASICGGAFVLMNFSAIPTLFLFLTASAGIMTLGGLRGWGACIGAMFIGCAVAMVIFGLPDIDYKVPELSFIVTVSIATVGYVTVLSYFSFKQARSLLTAQKELERKQSESATLSRKLAKYLPPQVWGSIFSGQTDVKLQTQRKKLSVYFSDIKGFSEISEELQPEALTELLNSYFTEMSRIALKYGGTIDKFVGDAILIFFGDPTSRGHKQDAIACVSMAIEMRKRMKMLRQRWRQHGINKPLQVRMGINTGYCTVGNFGAETRMDYTIIGKEVNLASRLESVAQPEEILISESTYNLVRDTVMCRDRGQINVKGFSKPVPIFEIVDLRKELGASQSFVECELDGFTMYVDIDKIRNYDKDRVIQALESASKRIKEKLIV